MRVKICVEALATVPNDENLRSLSMALQDSPTLLDEYLNKEGYEVIVYSMPSVSATADAPEGQ